MVKRLTLKDHLTTAEIERAYRQARDPVARGLWQVLWLLARGEPTAAVARATGYAATWISQVVRRYNAEGAAGVGDRRQRNPGAARSRPPASGGSCAPPWPAPPPAAGCGAAPRSPAGSSTISAGPPGRSAAGSTRAASASRPRSPARAMQGQYLGCCAGRQLPLRRPLKYRDPLLLLRVHTPHLPVGHRAAG